MAQNAPPNHEPTENRRSYIPLDHYTSSHSDPHRSSHVITAAEEAPTLLRALGLSALGEAVKRSERKIHLGPDHSSPLYPTELTNHEHRDMTKLGPQRAAGNKGLYS
ncbi:Hypothetical predicted protein [Pelobates cultripes]|uniref:Uncharacterized protein n=1 Tax=Pelobates cultripes TaxID=61616 RepID=A0AAD1RCW8_PELCU|nr:Hypothetical predicted protein [Pelobates cultripes]